MLETKIRNKIFKEIGGRQDCRLFRNNCGMAIMPDGSRVKFGIANPGGADLIGWRAITVTPDMIGDRVAVFLAIEVKPPKKKATKKQENFICQVRISGGLAGVAHNTAEALKIIDSLGENI